MGLPQEWHESCVLTVWALTTWPMNQTVIVSLLRWLKSIKGPRFIGEAAFSMNSSFCTATWLERWDIRDSKSFLQFLVLPFIQRQAPGIRWITDIITFHIRQSDFYSCWAFEIHWNRKIVMWLQFWKLRQKFWYFTNSLVFLRVISKSAF